MVTNDDNRFMQRALQLAELGGANVAPNPMVGAVIVHKGAVIGEGYHQKYGEAHAEVNAVDAVKDQHLLSESTMYVTLEPCAHHGKTPPCADLLVRHKFKRVVIACVDSFSEVAGRGIERLESNGIEVTVGVLEEQAREVNKRFFCFHEKKRPYVLLKWAQTTDGLMDRSGKERKEGVNWITQPASKNYTHQWRSEEQAILVGWKTIENDQPSLTVREVKGSSPHRIILDPNCSSSVKSTVYNDGLPTTIFVKKNKFVGLHEAVEVVELQEVFNVQTILAEIAKKQFLSVFVEGGSRTINEFIQANLWDEARVFTGAIEFGEGIPAPTLGITPVSTKQIGKDQLTLYRNI